MEPLYPSPLHHAHLPAHDDGRLETIEEDRDARPKARAVLSEDSDIEAQHGIYLPSKRQRTGFNCTHCNMAFTEKRALARHKKTDHHRRQLGLPPDRKHACHICGKHFTRGHDLKRHQNEQHSEIGGGAVEISSAGSEHSSEHASSVDDYLPMAISQAPSAMNGMSRPAIIELGARGIPPLPPNKPLPGPDYAALRLQPEPAPRRSSESATQTASAPRYARRSQSMQANVKQEQSLRDVDLEPESVPTVASVDSIPQLTSSGSSDTSASSDHASELFPPLQTRANMSGGLRLANIVEGRMPTYGELEFYNPEICPICHNEFEDGLVDLTRHLRQHLDSFKGKHRCKECKIDFTHQGDLERHQQSAAKGHCGFMFDHECTTGHHPPGAGMKSDQLTDYDRARLCYQLQNWEQAQLQAYIANVSDLTMARQQRKFARWSEVLRGSSRRGSFQSFAISVNTYATAPCDVSDGKMDLGGLQKRLQAMSLGSAGSRFRRKLQPDIKDSRSKTIDKSLQRAVKHGDLSKAQAQLRAGGDAKIVHNDQGTFITVALWGRGYISSRWAEHRVDEDITGKCSTCKINSSTFSKPYYKIKSLLLHGADPNEPGGLQGHPLSTAAWMGKVDIVKLLLEYGGKMLQGGGEFGNAMCNAAAEAGYQGQADVIKLLIETGADVRAAGPAGSPLDLARNQRNKWSAQLVEATTQVEYDELQSRVDCCDKVICSLQSAAMAHDARDVATRNRVRSQSSQGGVMNGMNDGAIRATTSQSMYTYW